MSKEWVKLYLKLQYNTVFNTDVTATYMFIFCLLRAYPTGSFTIGRLQIENQTPIKGITAYKALKRLEKAQMVNMSSNNRFTTISILNWSDYQSVGNNLSNNTVTTEEQLSNNTVTHGNKNKKEKENKNIPSISPLTFSDEVLEELRTKFPLKDVEGEIDKAKDYLASKGKKYKDYLAFMRNWLRNSHDVRSVARTAPVEVEEEIDYREDPEYRERAHQKLEEGRALLAAKMAMQETN